MPEPYAARPVCAPCRRDDHAACEVFVCHCLHAACPTEAQMTITCQCGTPESEHGWGDPPHMFTPYPFDDALSDEPIGGGLPVLTAEQRRIAAATDAPPFRRRKGDADA